MKEVLLSFLRDLGAHEAVGLLKAAEFSSSVEPGIFDEPILYLTIRCAKLDADALDALPTRDRQRIVDGWLHADPTIAERATPTVDRLSLRASLAWIHRIPFLRNC